MENDILKFEMISSAADDKYRIGSAREIESVLHNVAQMRERVALYYGDANDFMLTTLLGVDGSGIWLEQGPDSAANRAVAEGNKLIFVSSLQKVKIQFTAGRPDTMQYQGRPAFFLPLPESLFRLQRRDYFRLMTPALDPLKCVIAGKYLPQKKPREVTIMDISGSGVALTCAENDTDLVPGNSYPDCRIDIPEFGTITGTILVKNLALLTNAAGRNYQRAGCELKNMDNASAMLLQRYVMHLQRSR